MSYKELKSRIDAQQVTFLDGGIGTEILRRGYTWASHQLKSEPELNLEIHQDYINAGADVITPIPFNSANVAFEIISLMMNTWKLLVPGGY